MNSFRLFCFLIVAFLFGFHLPAVAQDKDRADQQAKDPSQLGSLMKVPDTAGFYMATMNHEALYNAVIKSNAWQRIKKSEVARGMRSAYRRGKTKGYAEYNEDNPFAQYLKFYGDTFDNFFVNSGMEVAKQIVGNEVFIYVDNDMAELLETVRETQNEIVKNLASEFDLEDLADGDSPKLKAAMKMAFTKMGKRLTDIDCPTMIIGSRLEDPEGFRGMLELMQSGVEAGMNELPPDYQFVQDGWKVIDEGENFFMTFNVDLAELPLDLLLAEEEDAELVAAVEEFVLNKQGSLGLGISGNLLLMGIAKDSKKLTDFGTGGKLIDLPELSQLNDSIQKNEAITGVYYISQDYIRAQYSILDTVETFLPVIEKGFFDEVLEFEENSKADREQFRQQLVQMIIELKEDWESIWPKSNFGYGFAKLEDEGIRGHLFSGSQLRALDSSKVLQLTQHASAETVLLAVQRPRDLPKYYGIASKWTSRMYGWVEEEAVEQAFDAIERTARLESLGGSDLFEDEPSELDELPELTPEQQAKVKQEQELMIEVLNEYKSFVKKFDQTTRNGLLPAIKGEEIGLFFEMVKGPESWYAELADTVSPQQLPLPVLIVGHNSQKNVVAVVDEYLQHGSELLESLKTIESKYPEEDGLDIVMDFQFEKSEKELATFFQFAVERMELEPTARPSLLVTKDKIVVSPFQSLAVNMARSRSPNLFGPVSESKPSSFKLLYDNRVLMRGLKAWSIAGEELAEETAADQGIYWDLSQYEAERDTLQFTPEQVSDYFGRYWDLGGCWKGLSTSTYTHNDGMATDFLFKFRDVESDK